MKVNRFIFTILFIAILVFSGCKRFKNSKVGKVYHSTTAHYNAYFNGNEKLKEVKNNLFLGTDDDYNKILAIYGEGTESGSKSSFNDLDISIKKATKVIKKHETSKWVDDAYFMVGESYYFKRDYFASIETFQFVRDKYPKDKLGFRSMIWIAKSYLGLKKNDEAQAQFTVIKSTKGFPKELFPELHAVQAQYYINSYEYKKAADLLEKALPSAPNRKYKFRWYFILGQLNAKAGEFTKSNFYYNKVLKGNAPFELSFQAKMGLADSYSKQKPKEKNSIKKFLNRLTKDIEYKKYYGLVYAKLSNIAYSEKNNKAGFRYLKMSSANSGSNKYQKTETLARLGEESFNMSLFRDAKSYYDSAITSAPADMMEAERKKITYKTNSELSGYLRGVQAEDSLQKIAKLSLSDIQAKITSNIKRKAKLEDDERNTQEKLKKAAEKKAKQDELFNNTSNADDNNFSPNGGGNPFANQNSGNNGGNNSATSSTGGALPANTDLFGMANSTGGWYFYNEYSMKIGFSDFKKKWGNRANIDDWRKRRNTVATDPNIQKKTAQEIAQANNSGIDSSAFKDPKKAEPKTDPKSKQGTTQNSKQGPDSMIALMQPYLDSVPFKPFFSNQRYQEALYGAGNTYYESLQNLEKSAYYFEELLRLYPDYSNNLEVHYKLYQIYSKTGEGDKALVHKTCIFKKAPASKWATYITSPERAREMANAKQDTSMDNLYAQTYAAYKSGDCKKVADGYVQALQNIKNLLMAKFDFLNTLCIGQRDSGKFMVDSLTSLVTRYPGSEVAIQATKLSELLKIKKIAEEAAKAEQLAKATQTSEANGKKLDSNSVQTPIPYVMDEKAIQLFVFSYKDVSINNGTVKARISDFNTENYPDAGLEIITTSLENDYQLVIVKNFVDLKQAVEYYALAKKNQIMFDVLKAKNSNLYLIDNNNLRLLRDRKDIKEYYQWFLNTY